jgi:hypothetical protein
MHVDQLPRDESGVVIGDWKLRHRDREFSETLGSVPFAGGESTLPANGCELDRIMTNMGDDLSAEPWAQTAPIDGVQSDAKNAIKGRSGYPANAAEILAMDETELRATAEKLGSTDKRWKAARLRAFIADELGIDIGED